jgi:hypothetical protein
MDDPISPVRRILLKAGAATLAAPVAAAIAQSAAAVGHQEAKSFDLWVIRVPTDGVDSLRPQSPDDCDRCELICTRSMWLRPQHQNLFYAGNASVPITLSVRAHRRYLEEQELEVHRRRKEA